MKILFTFCLLIFCLISTCAQKKQNLYLFKDNGREVFNRDSADFVRVIQEPDSGETDYTLLEYYKNGAKKSIGRVSSFEPTLVYEGSFVSYNKMGGRKTMVSYVKNEKIGMAYYFFDNGKVNKQIEYLPNPAKDGKKTLSPEFKVIFQADSLDVILVKDGNGHAVDYTQSDDDELVEEGDYKDGFKDGTWVGRYKSGKSSYTESYGFGKFISGINTVDGVKYEYNTLGTPPNFKLDVNKFYQYLGNSIKYPADAVRNRTMGTVRVTFVIEKDGSIVDAEVVRSVSTSIDQEALRVVMDSQKWTPGISRGVPVRVKYTVPITFHMQ